MNILNLTIIYIFKYIKSIADVIVCVFVCVFVCVAIRFFTCGIQLWHFTIFILSRSLICTNHVPIQLLTAIYNFYWISSIWSWSRRFHRFASNQYKKQIKYLIFLRDSLILTSSNCWYRTLITELTLIIVLFVIVMIFVFESYFPCS